MSRKLAFDCLKGVTSLFGWTAFDRARDWKIELETLKRSDSEAIGLDLARAMRPLSHRLPAHDRSRIEHNLDGIISACGGGDGWIVDIQYYRPVAEPTNAWGSANSIPVDDDVVRSYRAYGAGAISG